MPLVELSAEDLELRKRALGASEFAAVAGLNPWQSALDVWLLKTGRAEPRPDDERSRMGKRIETLIGDWYCDEVLPHSFEKPHTLVHPTESWMIATPDLFAYFVDRPNRRCEIKLVGSRVRPHWQSGGELAVPEYVVAQCLIQGIVSRVEPCDVAVWFGLDREQQHILSVPWMPDIAAELQQIGHDFWHRNVLGDVPPPADRSDSWREYLNKLWPKNDRPIVIEAPVAADPVVERLLLAKAQIKEGEELKQEAENELKSLIGDFDGVQRRGKWRATWKCDAHGTIDWKALAINLGATDEQADRYRREAPRRFLVREF